MLRPCLTLVAGVVKLINPLVVCHVSLQYREGGKRCDDVECRCALQQALPHSTAKYSCNEGRVRTVEHEWLKTYVHIPTGMR